MAQTPISALMLQARARDGLFLLGEALDCGVSASILQRLLREGVVERVHRALYRFTSHAWCWDMKQRAAVMAGGPTACASHAGAARWLGIRSVPVARPEIWVLGKAPALGWARVHRARSLPDCDVTERMGHRCTTGARTLVDLGGRLGPIRSLAAVDAAICAGITTRTRLHRRACELRPGREGVGPLIRVTAPGAEGPFWSALERRFGAGMRAHDLPSPVYNARVVHRGRTLYADALWAEHGVVAELHSLAFHSAPPERGRDDERLNAFSELGLRAVVFGWAQVQGDMPEVVRTIAATLGVPSG